MTPLPRVYRLLIAVALAVWLATLVAGQDHWPTLPGTHPAPAAGAPNANAALDRLTVAPETDAGSYDRHLFGDWATGEDGCTTRERILIDQSLTPATVTAGCHVVAGQWLSVYDGATVTDPTALDIDHVVALGEAWTSGAARWSAEQRHAFANDLEHPGALIAVTAATNRSKGDQDPAEWLPPAPEDRCAFAAAWVTQKAAWHLSVDPAERDALAAVLATCPAPAAATGGPR